MSYCDPGGRIFLSVPPRVPHTHDKSFSCIPFISESGFFDNAVTSIAGVRHIDDNTV